MLGRRTGTAAALIMVLTRCSMDPPLYLHPVEASALGVKAHAESFHLDHSALLCEVNLRLIAR